MEWQQSTIAALEKELDSLRKKNQSILECVNEKISQMSISQKYVEINNKVYRDIKAYLQ